MKSKKNWMQPRMILMTLSLIMLAPSCSLPAKQSATALSQSALYDPPLIHLVEGMDYQTVEGVLKGRGQIFYSDYTYRIALQLGKEARVTPAK